MRYLVAAVLCLTASLSFAQTYCGGFLANREVDGGGVQNQTQFNQVQQWSGWGSCDNSICSGGIGSGACRIEPYQRFPSLSGDSTEIYDDNASLDDALFFKKFATSTATNFDTKYNNVNQLTFDYWFKVDSKALTNGRTAEFDSFQFYFVNGGGGNTCDCCPHSGLNYCYRFMAGTQCDSTNPLVPQGDWGWDLWDSKNGTWHNGYQNIQCQGLLDGNWHEVKSVVSLVHTAGSLSYTFTSLTVDGHLLTLGSNTTFQPAITDDFPNLGVQFQIDQNGGGYHEWFDNVTLGVTYSSQ